MKRDHRSRPGGHVGAAARIVLLYAIVAVLWIALSDAVVSWLAGNAEAAARFQTCKGLVFVLVTASFLHALIARMTHRLEAESAARRESEERFRSLHEQSHDGIVCYEFDPPISTTLPTEEQARRIAAGRVVECNVPAAKTLHVDNPEDALGRELGSLLRDMDTRLDEEIREFVRNSYRLVDFEAVDELPDGTKCYYLDNAFGVIEDDGLVCAWVASRDVTERRLAMESLLRGEQRLRRIVEDQTEFIVRWLPDGTRTFVNDAYCRYYGIAREEALGSSLFPLISDEDRAGVDQRIERLTPEHPVSTGEHRVFLPGGGIGWNQWTDRAILDDHGHVSEYQSVGRDITERKRTEETIRRLVDVSSRRFGESFFDTMALELAVTLGADYALVGELTGKEPDSVRTLAVVADGGRVPDFEYELAGTPCANVVGKSACSYESNVADKFPEDDLLREMSVSGYVGVPLFDSTGAALGLMAALYRSPVTDGQSAEPILQVFAARVGGELERVRAEKVLREGEEQLKAEQRARFDESERSRRAVLGMLEDQRRTEEALRRREAELRRSQFIAHFGSYSWDLLTDDMVWSEELHRLLWCEDEEPSFELFLSRIHPGDREAVNAQSLRIREADAPHDMEYRLLGPYGTVRWVHDRIEVDRDEQGRPVSIHGTSQDITDRKTAEEKLSESSERLRLALQAAQMGTWEWDIQKNRVVWSPETMEVFGTDSDGFGGTYESYLGFACPEERAQVDGNVRAFLKNAVGLSVVNYEHGIVRGDGTSAWIEVRGTLFLDSQGRPSRMTGVCADITNRKLTMEQLQDALSEITRLKKQVEAENTYLREEVRMAHLHGDIVGRSDTMKSVLAQAEQVAGTEATVLILGETGTGKELLARAIHNMSRRKDKALVAVNCAAMPASLVESELFGREKGAYTGALTRQVGRFEAADGGTVFLDEIGELPAETQAKLLRVLQEGEFERLGSTETIIVDVRVIAATNRDLDREVRGGGFREDLYFRLNVFPIMIPPLRDRRDDVEPLVWSFVNEFVTSMGKRIETISKADMDRLRGYAWPGNVRELRNVVERAMIAASGTTLKIAPPAKAPGQRQPRAAATLEEVQRLHITSVLEQTGWRIRGDGGAAEVLGMKPSTLESRMAKLGITRPAS